MNLSLTGSRHQLINQLVYFDEELHQFLELYFPSPTKSRTYTEERLQEYSEALTDLISEFSEELLHSKVLIGSKVQIRYLDDNQSDTYSIVFPSKTDPSSNRISSYPLSEAISCWGRGNRRLRSRHRPANTVC